MKVGVGQAAKALGGSISTVQRWEKEGRISGAHPHGYRRYDRRSGKS